MFVRYMQSMIDNGNSLSDAFDTIKELDTFFDIASSSHRDLKPRLGCNIYRCIRARDNFERMSGMRLNFSFNGQVH